MPVTFQNHDIRFILKHKRRLKQWIRKVIEDEGKKAGEINLVFGSDPWLLDMNKEYLQHDYYTDVITFDAAEDKQQIEGDICISIDRVRENAESLGTSFETELHRVIIHGVLHLLGYNDKTGDDKRAMTRLEDAALKKLSAFP